MSSTFTSAEMMRSEIAHLPFEETELNGSILARFRRVIAALPANHLAYVDAEESFTYAELDQRSEQLAATLIEQLAECLAGVEVADKQLPVALLLPHEFVSLVGILGTLKAGHFYVPLDENQGEALLQQTLNDCTPQALVTTSALHNLAVKLLGKNCRIPILDIKNLSEKLGEDLEKETHLEENGLCQQTHNPKVRHEQKAYHKTEKCRLLCRPETVVETD